jgi:hypothetical protein
MRTLCSECQHQSGGGRGVDAVQQLQLQVHTMVGTSSVNTGIDAHVFPGYPETRAVAPQRHFLALEDISMSSRIRPLPLELQLGACTGAWARQKI